MIEELWKRQIGGDGMNQSEVIIIGLLLTMVFGMFVVGKWVMVTMITVD